MPELKIRHGKTPSWSSGENIYFYIFKEDTREPIGYIGLQDLDFTDGSCNNICYKMKPEFRGLGLMKKAFNQFINEIPFKFDIIKASCSLTNIPSQKILESAGFKRVSAVSGSIKYSRKKFDY